MISLYVYVDDVAMSFLFDRKKDTEDIIRMRVANAYRKLAKGIIQGGANFAKGKGKIVASDPKIANVIASELNEDRCNQSCITIPYSASHCMKTCKAHANRSIESQKTITVLGVDYSAGNPIDYSRARQRLKDAKSKANKIVSLTKGGWRAINMMRSHVVAAVTYSARVNGMPNDVLQETRTIVRRATSTKAGIGLCFN